MSDFGAFGISITRGELGLIALDLNDHVNYIVSEQLMGAQQTWNRQTVKSPFVDGEFTVHRAAGSRHEALGVQVLGGTQTQLQVNLQALTDALSQFRFQLTMVLDETSRTWQCETADFTVDYNQHRWMTRQVLVNAQIPTYPGLVS